jgi:mono/diheme cytochrome c family protein
MNWRGMMWCLVALPTQVAAAPTAAAASPSPAETFRAHCAVCHGDAGEGIAGPPLRPLQIPAADVAIVVREGRGQMPPFAPEQLTDDALTALAGFLAAWR